MNEDYEEYFPPICIHCTQTMSSVILEKTYNWNQTKEEFQPDNYEFVFVCTHCRGEVGGKLEDGTYKWYTPIDFGEFGV